MVRTLERRDIQRRLALEVTRILAETVAVPVTDEGRIVGLSLTRIAEGTVLSETGLRPGDVLTKLNDTPVDGLPTLLTLWPRFETESQIRAEVLRNGQPLTLTLNIR
jgi:type II secretory pathway component PulC